MSYYLDRLEEIGEKKLADSIRALLPSKAKEAIKKALHDNEMQIQEYMRKHKVYSKFSHAGMAFSDKENILKGLLREIEGR